MGVVGSMVLTIIIIIVNCYKCGGWSKYGCCGKYGTYYYYYYYYYCELLKYFFILKQKTKKKITPM